MEFEALIAVVGESRYRLACEWSWRIAAESMNYQPPQWPDDLADVPHDLSDQLWYEGETAMAERLEHGIRLLREMPCYANTMYLHHFYDEWAPKLRSSFWDAYIDLLDRDDASPATVVGYSLWVDHFGSEERGGSAWDAVFANGVATPARRLDRALPLTGPVPWPLKAPLLRSLAVDRAHHAGVYRALLGAEFDVFGSIDRSEARTLLDGLVLPASAEHLSDLRARLAG